MLPGIKEARGTYSFNILAELSKFNNPAPCSYMGISGSRTAPSTKACFIDAGFNFNHLSRSGTTEANKVTAPATTGDATDVPDRERQPPDILLPNTS